jgi:hypothetical protein
MRLGAVNGLEGGEKIFFSESTDTAVFEGIGVKFLKAAQLPPLIKDPFREHHRRVKTSIAGLLLEALIFRRPGLGRIPSGSVRAAWHCAFDAEPFAQHQRRLCVPTTFKIVPHSRPPQNHRPVIDPNVFAELLESWAINVRIRLAPEMPSSPLCCIELRAICRQE